MQQVNAQQIKVLQIARRPPVVLASLVILAVLGFWGVNRLVTRFGEQQKALARHLYQRSLSEQRRGQSEAAVSDLRAALDYNPDNFQYQLSLARLLRDSGNIPEAEAYLVNLWERDPQNGAVNLALARLFARQHSTQKAIQYYRNAMYGVWAEDPESERREIRLEMVQYLLAEKDFTEAQAELISWTSLLPSDPASHSMVANLFAQAHDYEHALEEYQKVLRHGKNPAALAGAGLAAYQLGRYRSAQNYLQAASNEGTENPEVKEKLRICSELLNVDPFLRRLSTTERNRRAKSAFQAAGTRLQDCAAKLNIDFAAAQPSGDLPLLHQRWQALRSSVRHIDYPNSADVRDSAMDMVFDVEQKTQELCGPPSGIDQALLLLSQNPSGADR